MTNGEKYKGAEERAEAFDKFCVSHTHECHGKCPVSETATGNGDAMDCGFYWLDLEAEEEEPLPCPFCGRKVQVIHDTQAIAENAKWLVNCYGCQYEYGAETKEKLIFEHNRVARAVSESKEVENG